MATLGPLVDDVQQRLDGNGRVLVRPSGTEPLVRVMVEAPTEAEAAATAEELAGAVRSSA
jgi:phosphoglucosamine mutase